MYLSHIAKCNCLKLQSIFVLNWQIDLSQIAKCICLKLQNVFVSNFKMYLFQIAKWICLQLQNLSVSNCKMYLSQITKCMREYWDSTVTVLQRYWDSTTTVLRQWPLTAAPCHSMAWAPKARRPKWCIWKRNITASIITVYVYVIYPSFSNWSFLSSLSICKQFIYSTVLHPS